MHTILIANRGEIALRIIRTARERGIRTVLAASEADADSLAARHADEVAVIGPPPAGSSYLSIDAVLRAARETGADAVHPGYGFLSENATFARGVTEAGLIWVGPDAGTIELMGNKSRARQAAQAAGVPILPGTEEPIGTEDDALAIAADIGYPLVVKAAAGGGGRGIRLVESAGQLLSTIELAQAEARAAFGDASVYLERFIPRARHVEVQILGDGESFIHLGDRDCSMQRRQQKVIEEAPAPELPDTVRRVIRESSVELARHCGYRGAGTVEFLYDPQTQSAAFIEMNTRLQVEHPVTEQVTGLDLVAEQLRIAEGRGLSLRQDEVRLSGHAFEVRLNAEDPANSFMPSPGTITVLRWPVRDEVRIDSGVEEGSTILPYYDSMIAKLIVSGPDRRTALDALTGALDELRIEGIRTTVPLLRSLVRRPELADATHFSTFIETTEDLLEAP